MLGTLMTMFFNNAANVGPNKSDDLDTNGGAVGLPASPWANVISVGKLIQSMFSLPNGRYEWYHRLKCWKKKYLI